MADYNGWTNWETWLVNIYFGSLQDEMVESCKGDKEQVAKELEAAVLDVVQRTLGDNRSQYNPEHSFVNDLLSGGLEAVNWQELAESWCHDYEAEEVVAP